ncbi:segregation/condensation protein A [Bacillus sp. M6-12]|uniref:segregation/condensation protein A n=1 Tax=Bacillus sp. M6-12 TaxID=2054166 RepID=UPI000C774A01|nr:segregation/condensation protein A [Bacillus sp. M6-12]PLS16402.1 segregation/condensation protein A [Bacillus sp. M6-12]
MAYNVKIEAFEGPMDLLLHLINRLEIDIYDIPMAEITGQYMAYIHAMKELELDIASEYLVMAATLLAIKSKMLLPVYEDDSIADNENDFDDDPRDELVEKLIEYRKYKEAAVEFKQMEEERSLMFSKPPSDLSQFSKEIEPSLQELNVTLYDMLGAFQKLLRRQQFKKPAFTKITRQEISIEKRMEEIMVNLKKATRRTSFFDLFPRPEKEYIVVTFLAVLELMKLNEIFVEQDSNFAEIYVVSKEGVEAVGTY